MTAVDRFSALALHHHSTRAVREEVNRAGIPFRQPFGGEHRCSTATNQAMPVAGICPNRGRRARRAPEMIMSKRRWRCCCFFHRVALLPLQQPVLFPCMRPWRHVCVHVPFPTSIGEPAVVCHVPVFMFLGGAVTTARIKIKNTSKREIGAVGDTTVSPSGLEAQYVDDPRIPPAGVVILIEEELQETPYGGA